MNTICKIDNIKNLYRSLSISDQNKISMLFSREFKLKETETKKWFVFFNIPELFQDNVISILQNKIAINS